jgi:hypothetical protein
MRVTSNGILRFWVNTWERMATAVRFGIQLATVTFWSFVQFFTGRTNGMKVDWTTVWEGIQTTTRNVVRVIGGIMAGLINIFVELMAVQQDGRTGFQHLGESVRAFAVAGVDSVMMFVRSLLITSAIVASLISSISFMTKDFVGSLKWAAAAKAMQVSLGFMMEQTYGPMNPQTGKYGGGPGGNGLMGYLKTIDTDSIAGNMKDLSQRPGVVGAFARGYQGFTQTFDQGMVQFNNANPAPYLPNLPGSGPRPAVAPDPGVDLGPALPAGAQVYQGNLPTGTGGGVPMSAPGGAGLPAAPGAPASGGGGAIVAVQGGARRPGLPPALDIKTLQAQVAYFQAAMKANPGMAAQIRSAQYLPALRALHDAMQRTLPGMGGADVWQRRQQILELQQRIQQESMPQFQQQSRDQGAYFGLEGGGFLPVGPSGGGGINPNAPWSAFGIQVNPTGKANYNDPNAYRDAPGRPGEQYLTMTPPAGYPLAGPVGSGMGFGTAGGGTSITIQIPVNVPLSQVPQYVASLVQQQLDGIARQAAPEYGPW